MLVLAWSVTVYGQKGQPLEKRGYELADLITAEMQNIGYTYDYEHPEERIRGCLKTIVN